MTDNGLSTTDLSNNFVTEPTSTTVPSGTLIVTLTCVAPPSYPPAVVTWLKSVPSILYDAVCNIYCH